MSALNIDHNKSRYKQIQNEQNVKESKVKSEFPQLCKFLSGLIFCLSFDLFKSSQPTLHRENVAVAKLPRLLLIIASGTRDEGGGDDDVSPRREVFDIFEQFCNLKQDPWHILAFLRNSRPLPHFMDVTILTALIYCLCIHRSCVGSMQAVFDLVVCKHRHVLHASYFSTLAVSGCCGTSTR